MPTLYLKNKNQKDAVSSPWSRREAIMVRIWELIWTFLIKWLPKKASLWYVFWLRIFGCRIPSHIFIHPSVRIYAPWLLSIDDHACLGARCEVYNLGPVCIGKRTTIAQYAYICNGTHKLDDLQLPLVVGDINIEDDVFIGAKALILPGISIAQGCIIGAGSVLSKDTTAWGVYAGNPARYIKTRVLKDSV